MPTREDAQFWNNLDRGQGLEERLIQASLSETPDLADVKTSVLFEEVRSRAQTRGRDLKEIEELLAEGPGNKDVLLGLAKSTAADLSEFRQNYEAKSRYADTRDSCLAAGGLSVVGACLVFIGSVLFGGPDLSGIERQLYRLQSTVKYVAKEQGVSFPEVVRVSPSPLPTVRIERVESTRLLPPSPSHQPLKPLDAGAASSSLAIESKVEEVQ